MTTDQDREAGQLTARLNSFGQTQDYIAVDTLIESGQYTGLELMMLANDEDREFNRRMFGYRLLGVKNIPTQAAADFGLSEDEFAQIQRRLSRWGQGLLGC
ncbi:hypothetical protein [Arcanobacterium canis]